MSACGGLSFSAKSELSGLIRFYGPLLELGGNSQANVLTTVHIHFVNTHTHTLVVPTLMKCPTRLFLVSA